MQAILKDVQMREQAHLIQREVAKLMDDMGRLRERVLDLQRHFGQANDDIDKILTSSDKIAARGRKIEALEFEETAAVEHHNGGAAPSSGPPRVEPPSSPRGEGKARLHGMERSQIGGVMRQPDLLAKDA